MQQEIKDLIKKNLPEMAAKELKSYIEESEKKDNEIRSLKYDLEMKEDLWSKQLKVNDDLKKQIQEWETRLNKLREDEIMVQQRTKAIYEREIKVSLHEAQYKADEARRRSDDIFHLTEIIFKNPIVKKTVLSNEQVESKYVANEYNQNSGQYEDVVKSNGTMPKEETIISEVE
jgi:hypothetical protein